MREPCRRTDRSAVISASIAWRRVTHGPLNTASPSHLHARPQHLDGAARPLGWSRTTSEQTREPRTGQRKEQGSFLAGQDRRTAVK
jgi:hypothetical protein